MVEISHVICAVTCDFQQCGILTSVYAGEHVQPPFKLRTSKRCSASSLTQRRVKALIRLRVCAGWSEPLLVSHITLLKISSNGSFNNKFMSYRNSKSLD